MVLVQKEGSSGYPFFAVIRPNGGTAFAYISSTSMHGLVASVEGNQLSWYLDGSGGSYETIGDIYQGNERAIYTYYAFGHGTTTEVAEATFTLRNTGEDSDTAVGIASVKQTTISTEDEGVNVITVTLTNGVKSTFTVENGSKGSAGVGITNITIEEE
jgi:hypothetical protein